MRVRTLVQKEFEFRGVSIRASRFDLMDREPNIVAVLPSEPFPAIRRLDRLVERPVRQLMPKGTLVASVNTDLDIGMCSRHPAKEQVDRPAPGDKPWFGESPHKTNGGENRG